MPATGPSEPGLLGADFCLLCPGCKELQTAGVQTKGAGCRMPLEVVADLPEEHRALAQSLCWSSGS